MSKATSTPDQARPGAARAHWSLRLLQALCVASVGLSVAGPLFAFVHVVPPMVGFVAMSLGLLLGIASLLCALGVIVVRLRRGRGKRDLLWSGAGAAVGLGSIGFLAMQHLAYGELPRINDITTNLDDPPEFIQLSQVPENHGREMGFPEEFRASHAEAYPDLRTLALELPPDEAMRRVQRVAGELGWEAASGQMLRYHYEGTDTSALFHFVDDIVVRVRESGSGSVVDVRSKSRDGQGDLGVNAERIRRFAKQLEGGSEK